MIGARLPQDSAPAHALEADENVLDGVVERMAHMQRARHIGRRDHDGEGLGFRAPAAFEQALLFPLGIEPGFDRGGRIGLFKHYDWQFRWGSAALNTTVRLDSSIRIVSPSAGLPRRFRLDGRVKPGHGEKYGVAMTRASYRPPRRATRAISSRTRRSTISGRFSSSHCLSMPRSKSRVRSSIGRSL